jgi:Domain of unknown function (DUF4198)
MQKMISALAFALGLTLTLASQTRAHEFWLEAAPYHVALDTPVRLSVFIGHGSDREGWPYRWERLASLRSIAPDGLTTDRQPDLAAAMAANAPLQMKFSSPGLHVVLLETTPILSDLPADRLNKHFKDNGLTPALEARKAAGTEGQGGRELYSRRVKALIQAGPIAPNQPSAITRPLGQTLEIVPTANPYQLPAGSPWTVKILFRGKPLAGATVTLSSLDLPIPPIMTQISDAKGDVTLKALGEGRWIVHVVWLTPLANQADMGLPDADYFTVFSSLTFGYPKRS